MDIHLPEPQILQRYLDMLHRALRATRAYARGTHASVVAELTAGIELDRPDPSAATVDSMATYLKEIERTIIKLRYTCTSLIDAEGKPFALDVDAQTGCRKARYPDCDSAMELLDAIHNFPSLLMQWNDTYWCQPRGLYDGLRHYEHKFEGGKSRFTGYLNPVEEFAPSTWASQPAELPEWP